MVLHGAVMCTPSARKFLMARVGPAEQWKDPNLGTEIVAKERGLYRSYCDFRLKSVD